MKHIIALLWVLAWLLFVPNLYAGPEANEVVISLGTSREITTQFPIGQIEQPNDQCFTYRRVQDGAGEIKKLLLIAKRPGTSDFLIHAEKSAESLRLRVRVSELGDVEAIKAQMEAEREEGIEVRPLVLTSAIQRLEMEKPIGPVYLTAPKFVEFRRIAGQPNHLLLAGLQKHQTDLWIHDEKGKLIVKYYVLPSVTGKGFPPRAYPLGTQTGTGLPPKSLPASAKLRVKFFDLQEKKLVPIY